MRHEAGFYLEQFALDRIVKEYVARGYAVKTNVRVKDFIVDAIASKGNEKIYFEIKSGKVSAHAIAAMQRLQKYVAEQTNARFKYVVATPPKDILVDIDWIAEAIEKHITDNPVEELDTLSTHTRILEVADIDIDSLIWHQETIVASGSGMVTVSLQYGSDSDQEPGDKDIEEIFPFDFEAVFGEEKNIEEMVEFKADTTRFHGD